MGEPPYKISSGFEKEKKFLSHVSEKIWAASIMCEIPELRLGAENKESLFLWPG